MGLNQKTEDKPVPAFRRPPPSSGWPARLLDGWLLQHYALIVWLTTGVRKRRPPLRFAKLSAAFRTFVSGQIFSIYVSLYFIILGRGLGTTSLVVYIILFGSLFIIFALPWLEKRLLHHDIPANFRKLDEGHRRRLAWVCFGLFWAAFSSIFFVAALLD